MNERIRLLAEQAGINQDQDEDGTRFLSMPESSWAKFAELIVKECIAQCESKNTIITTATGITHWGEISDAVEQIKQHFGVEE